MKQATLIAFLGLSILASSHVYAQGPEITGYNSDGTLTFTSASEGKTFSLEFSPSLTGPWTNWSSLTDQPITGVVMQTATPMFYRIVESPQNIPMEPSLTAILIGMGYDLNGDFAIDQDEADLVGNPTYAAGRGWLQFSYYASNIDLSPFTNAHSIVVCGHRLTNVILGTIPNLDNLYVSATKLSAIDVTGLPSLKHLFFDYEPCFEYGPLTGMLTVLDISMNTKLTAVSARGNPLTEIIVWDTNNLPSLYYDGTPWIHEP
jgi:hypothetical protein